MIKEVYLLYEGDEWLSKGSLVLMGIFTSDEQLKCNAEKLIRERGKQHVRHYEGQMCDGDGYPEDCKTMDDKVDVVVDDILEELLLHGATSGWEVNYCWTVATLDELGEI